MEGQRCGVEAVAFTAGRGAVGKDVAKVRVASAACDFGSDHSVGGVVMASDVLGVELGKETWPASAGCEFVFARKQRQSADHAAVDAVFLVIQQQSATGWFGTGPLCDLQGLGAQSASEVLADLIGQWGEVVSGLGCRRSHAGGLRIDSRGCPLGCGGRFMPLGAAQQEEQADQTQG